jgi:hypothetical protein
MKKKEKRKSMEFYFMRIKEKYNEDLIDCYQSDIKA